MAVDKYVDCLLKPRVVVLGKDTAPGSRSKGAKEHLHCTLLSR